MGDQEKRVWIVPFDGELRIEAEDQSVAEMVANEVVEALVGSGHLEIVRDKMTRFNVKFANLGFRGGTKRL